MPNTACTQLYPSLAAASDLLLESGLRVAVAESCTGGLLGAALTGVSGSSAYFVGGVVAYDDYVKTSLLAVPEGVIRQHGAVSEQCALALAKGVIPLMGSDIGISITGISGPLGGTLMKPVGTTYIGLVAPGLERVDCHTWDGDRSANRERSVEAALAMIKDYLESARRVPEAAKA